MNPNSCRRGTAARATTEQVNFCHLPTLFLLFLSMWGKESLWTIHTPQTHTDVQQLNLMTSEWGDLKQNEVDMNYFWDREEWCWFCIFISCLVRENFVLFMCAANVFYYCYGMASSPPPHAVLYEILMFYIISPSFFDIMYLCIFFQHVIW